MKKLVLLLLLILSLLSLSGCNTIENTFADLFGNNSYVGEFSFHHLYAKVKGSYSYDNGTQYVEKEYYIGDYYNGIFLSEDTTKITVNNDKTVKLINKQSHKTQYEYTGRLKNSNSFIVILDEATNFGLNINPITRMEFTYENGLYSTLFTTTEGTWIVLYINKVK